MTTTGCINPCRLAELSTDTSPGSWYPASSCSRILSLTRCRKKKKKRLKIFGIWDGWGQKRQPQGLIARGWTERMMLCTPRGWEACALWDSGLPLSTIFAFLPHGTAVWTGVFGVAFFDGGRFLQREQVSHYCLHHCWACIYTLTVSKWHFTVNSYGAVKDWCKLMPNARKTQKLIRQEIWDHLWRLV